MSAKKAYLTFFIVMAIFLGIGIVTSRLLSPDYSYLGEAIGTSILTIVSVIILGKKDLLKFEWKSFLKGMLYAAPLLAVSIYMMANHISSWSSFGEGFNKESIIMGIALFLGAGIGEELACRIIGAELFRQALGNTKKGVFKAVCFSSLFFGLCHLVNIFTFGQGIIETIVQVIYAFGFGCFFAAVYFKSRNIWACIITHWLFDVSNFHVETPFGIENPVAALIVTLAILVITGVVLACVYLSNYKFDKEDGVKQMIA
ncbi:MAG: CPBP family intramembrane metalloprotease [Pseudobutyrivibrio sp.]|nr:CPBP family intramembrane metalloprotease [Pseudobutyrivibrio sp.]